jgi:hypothetical protein
MPLDPVGTIVGLPEATAACHVWILWWARDHLGELRTDLIFHPYGGDVMRLYGSDVLSPLLLRWVPLPLTALYNGWVVLLLALGGVGAARLADRVSGSSRHEGARDSGGGWVALAVFEAAPFFRHELLNGTAELLGAAFLPWFAEALIDVLDEPDSPPPRARSARGAGLRAGAWGLAAALCSLYNLFFVVAIALVLLLARLTTQLGPVVAGARARGLAVGAGIGVVGIGLLGALHLRHGALDTLAARREVIDVEPPLPDAFADATAWLDPRAAALPVWMRLPEGEPMAYWTTQTVFLGFVAVGAALAGALRARRASRREGAGAWAVLGLVGFLIASGPWLRAGGAPVLVGGGGIPMPASTLTELVPGFAVTAPHAYRYASLVVLALAVLASRAVRGTRAGLLVGALVVAESLFASPLPTRMPVTTAPTSAVLAELATMPEGAVLTAPTRKDDLHDLGRAMLAQVIHGKPMQDGGMHHRTGEDSLRLFVDNPLVDALAARGTRTLPGARTTIASLRALRREGYGYLLVAVPEADVLAWAVATLGPPARRDAAWALWTLDTLPDPPERAKGSP